MTFQVHPELSEGEKKLRALTPPNSLCEGRSEEAQGKGTNPDQVKGKHVVVVHTVKDDGPASNKPLVPGSAQGSDSAWDKEADHNLQLFATHLGKLSGGMITNWEPVIYEMHKLGYNFTVQEMQHRWISWLYPKLKPTETYYGDHAAGDEDDYDDDDEDYRHDNTRRMHIVKDGVLCKPRLDDSDPFPLSPKQSPSMSKAELEGGELLQPLKYDPSAPGCASYDEDMGRTAMNENFVVPWEGYGDVLAFIDCWVAELPAEEQDKMRKQGGRAVFIRKIDDCRILYPVRPGEENTAEEDELLIAAFVDEFMEQEENAQEQEQQA
ncbi:hypothetical protein F5Y15DRAFT_414195 [Xylariaceae sp. FL0016]|nr:hypothetical protein F5Y15DRAFT_414195 [Xylariaceae sp. FL0016]